MHSFVLYCIALYSTLTCWFRAGLYNLVSMCLQRRVDWRTLVR